LEECFSFIGNCLENLHGTNMQAWLMGRYTRFLEQSSLGILHLNDHGNVLNVNDTFLNFFNVKIKDLLDFNLIDDLKALLLAPENERLQTCLNTGDVFTVHELLISKDHFLRPKEDLYFGFSLYIVREDEKDPIIVAMFFNETEKAKSKIQLEKAREEQANALKVKNEFLAQMGHELRTPLNSVLGYSELLISKLEQNSSLAGFAEHITKASKHLLEILNEILETSNIEFDNVVERKSLFNLHHLLVEIEASLSTHLSRQNAMLVLEKAIDLPVMVMMDRGKLRWIIDQLLQVLFSYLDNNTLKVSIEYQNLKLRFEFNSDNLKINQAFLSVFEQEDQLQDRLGLKNFIIKSHLKILKGNYGISDNRCLVIEMPLELNQEENQKYESKDIIFKDTKSVQKVDENILQMTLDADLAQHLYTYAAIGDLKSLRREIELSIDQGLFHQDSLMALLDMVENFQLKSLKKILDGSRNG
ncbi:PAS domain-containing sensor histidine kinase, partial [bacterium]|nr:PAS domain-containing sensor histidine kinase [bacterium]